MVVPSKLACKTSYLTQWYCNFKKYLRHL